MNASTATNRVAAHKGETLILTLTDGSTVEGTAISVNTKGVNLKDAEGKVFTKALSKVELIETETEYADRVDPQGDYQEDSDFADMDEDDEAEMIADEFVSGETDDLADIVTDEGGMTAAEAAAVFGVPATELRKVTRALGLGVGRGRRYLLDGEDLKKIRTEMAKVEAEAAA